MVFILGVGVGVLVTVGFALLSVASNADDVIDNNTDFR
jgi:xanthosine utilization system XapX-like protein